MIGDHERERNRSCGGGGGAKERRKRDTEQWIKEYQREERVLTAVILLQYPDTAALILSSLPLVSDLVVATARVYIFVILHVTAIATLAALVFTVHFTGPLNIVITVTAAVFFFF
ncbi:Hypothetical predicted protein [Octopus vulgaris]|uniref:Uncharacterized protein n=1 Tax=Octopus vulgaris TaxID=6645 RepID=A0AA36FC68_OCTVU|nr:Hypothetical predicted protein [Octopus vulgaris]